MEEVIIHDVKKAIEDRTEKSVTVELRTVEKMKEHAQGGTEYSGKCFMCESLCMDDAKQLAEMIEKEFPHLNGKVQIYPIGATIGSHTGPGTISIFFWGDERVD